MFVPVRSIQEQAARAVYAERYRLFDAICEKAGDLGNLFEYNIQIYSQIKDDPALVARMLKFFEIQA